MATTVSPYDPLELTELLKRRGHIRGNPVAISMFRDEIPEPYAGQMVEPCAIVRQAMDFGKHVFVDATHHSCVAGAWQAGFIEPPLEISTGSYLVDNTPFFTPEGALKVKTGENVLPLGTVRGIGAAPLDQVPAGVEIDTVVVVCEPLYASMIGGVRVAIDGTPPRGAAGTSLCGELFALPFHDRNVIITTGDVGGRMFNHVKPSEMFVIIPVEYLPYLANVVGARPNLTGLMEAIKPGYTAERDRKRDERAARAEAAGVAVQISGSMTTTMQWDDEARAVLAKAPAMIRDFAAPTLEEYAREQGYELITLEVMSEQMDSVGMRLDDVLAMADDDAAADELAGDDLADDLADEPPDELASGSDDSDEASGDRAPVNASASTTIAATPTQVWARLAEVGQWGSWYSDIRNVKVAGLVGSDAEFSFKTGPASVSATVSRWDPPRHLEFIGRSRGSTATYRFELSTSGDSTLVTARQAMTGLAARAMRPMMQKIAETSLPEWLEALKVICEAPAEELDTTTDAGSLS